MKTVKQKIGTCLFLATLIYASWYFTKINPLMPLDEETLENTADALITDLTVKIYDKEGKLTNFLQSPLMQHIPHENTNLFFKPHLLLGQQNQPVWDIQADNAKSLHNAEHLIFSGRVVIHQDKGQNNQESTMKTEELEYFPKKKFATTSLPVTFEQPGSVMKSLGMNAYLDKKHIELLSKAKLRYEPQKNA